MSEDPGKRQDHTHVPHAPQGEPVDGAHREERVQRTREILHADAEYVRSLLMNDQDPTRGQTGIHRMVDMRLPLWGILSALGALAVMFTTMWFNVQQLTVSVAEMQRSFREGLNTNNATDLEMARLMLRVAQIEEALRDNRLRLDQLQRDYNSSNNGGRRSSVAPPLPLRPKIISQLLDGYNEPH